MCTSTRNVREPTIGSMSTGAARARRWPRASLRAVWRRTSATVAAPATNPVAAAAAAWTAGRAGRRGRLDRPDLGEHRQAVDGLLFLQHVLGGQLDLAHPEDIVPASAVMFKAASRRPGSVRTILPPIPSIARFIDLFDSEDPARLAGLLRRARGRVEVQLVELGGDPGVLPLALDAEREHAHAVDLAPVVERLGPAERQQPAVQVHQHLVVVGQRQSAAPTVSPSFSATNAQFSSRIGFRSLA